MRYFFLFTAVILAVFGIGSILRINDHPDNVLLYGFYGFAMVGDAIAMLLCVWMLNKRMKFAFHLSVIVLALNILPAIFDQFGVADLFFILLNLFTLALLIAARKEFLPA